MQALVGLALALGQHAAAVPHADKKPFLRSESVVVRFADSKEILLAKNAEVVRPIASVTKLLSGLLLTRSATESASATVAIATVPAQAIQSAFSPTSTRAATPTFCVGTSTQSTVASEDDFVTIGEEDKDRLKWSRSRLRVGWSFRWSALFAAALGGSDNRAMYASVRARGYARPNFVELMNALARELGMERSHFRDPAGIDPGNVSTALDLLKLIDAAAAREPVRQATLRAQITLSDPKNRSIVLTNPDRLARTPGWQLIVGKTGYTVEAGRSLVLRAMIGDRPVDMVFLGAHEMSSVFGDAVRVRRWIEAFLQS
jgi:D-alanyl-D-alanine endopeptidase (penicillin-binding protein 7)